MKRKLIFSAALLALVCGASPCFAEDVVVVYPIDDGEPISTTIGTIAKIDFGPTAMTIVSTSGEVEIPYDEIQSIKFEDNGMVGLKTLTGENPYLTVKYAGQRLLIETDNQSFDVALFSLNGSTLLNMPNCQSHTIDVSHLSAGVYIAKVNNVVVKFVKK